MDQEQNNTQKDNSSEELPPVTPAQDNNAQVTSTNNSGMTPVEDLPKKKIVDFKKIGIFVSGLIISALLCYFYGSFTRILATSVFFVSYLPIIFVLGVLITIAFIRKNEKYSLLKTFLWGIVMAPLLFLLGMLLLLGACMFGI